MKYDKCTICNEKLRNGVCPMCGYDFKRLERGQRTGSCSDYGTRPNIEPKSSMTKQHKRVYRQFRTEEKGRVGKFIRLVLSLVVIFVVFLDAVGEVDIGTLIKNAQIYMSEDGKKKWTKTMPDFTYENADYALEKTGKSFSVRLSSGRYIVGLDLPEGNYTMTGEGDDLTFSANNDAQYVNINEQFTDKEVLEANRYTEVKNIRLSQGSLVDVSGKGSIYCKTSDANLKKMEKPGENTLSEEVKVFSVLTAGKEFPAGTYDVVAVEGNGSFEFTFEQDKDDEYGTNSIWLSEDSQGENPNKYVNLELTEGTKIEVLSEEYLDVKLVPSKRVRPENMHVYDSSMGLDS